MENIVVKFQELVVFFKNHYNKDVVEINSVVFDKQLLVFTKKGNLTKASCKKLILVLGSLAEKFLNELSLAKDIKECLLDDVYREKYIKKLGVNSIEEAFYKVNNFISKESMYYNIVSLQKDIMVYAKM